MIFPRSAFLILSVLGLAALTLPVAGCLSQPHPNKTSFALEAVDDRAAGSDTLKRRTLLAATVTAAAGFDNRGLVYKIGPERYETDFYNEFMAPPSRLLADEAAQYLDRHSSKVRAVKSPGLVIADFGLETYLEAIYGDFTVSPPEAVIAIRFTVNDLRPANTRVLLDKTYRHSRPFGRQDPAHLVAAFNESLTAILAELKKDIDRTIR